MASLSDLVAKLRVDAGIQETEFGNSDLQAWILAALMQHNKTYTINTLPPGEEEAVIILAWIKSCYARASNASLYYSVSGRAGSVNKAQIVDNNIRLLGELRQQYKDYCSLIGVSPNPLIAVSAFTKFDESADAMTPVSAHMPPQVCTLAASNYTGAKLDLLWSEAVPQETFLRYRLWVGNVAGLKDMTTVGDTEAQYNGVDLTKASLLITYDDKWRTSCRLTGLDATKTYYFVVVLEDCNGRFSVSNEVSTSEVSIPSVVDENFVWFTDPVTGKRGLRIINPDGEVLQEFLPPGA